MRRKKSYTTIWCERCNRNTKHILISKREEEDKTVKVYKCFNCGTVRESVRTKREKMIPTSFHIPKLYVVALERLVQRGDYHNVASAIRDAVRELLFIEEKFLQQFKDKDIEGITSISAHLPKYAIERIEKLVKLGVFMNKSSAFRHAIRDLLLKELKYYRDLEFLPA